MCLRRNYSPVFFESLMQMGSTDLKLSSNICGQSFIKIFYVIHRPRYSIQLGQRDYIQLKLTKTKKLAINVFLQPCSQDLYQLRTGYGPTHIEQWISGEQRELHVLSRQKVLGKTNARRFQISRNRFHSFMKISNSGKRSFLKF